MSGGIPDDADFDLVDAEEYATEIEAFNQAQQLQTVVAPRFPKATAYPKGMARGTPFVTGGSGTRSLVGTLAVDDPWMGDPDVPFWRTLLCGARAVSCAWQNLV